METNAILVNPRDNVAVAIREIKAGHPVSPQGAETVIARGDIPRYHKVALAEIPQGAAVIKYGERIGLAAQAILPGDWVHTHNLKPEEGS